MTYLHYSRRRDYLEVIDLFLKERIDIFDFWTLFDEIVSEVTPLPETDDCPPINAVQFGHYVIGICLINNEYSFDPEYRNIEKLGPFNTDQVEASFVALIKEKYEKMKIL